MSSGERTREYLTVHRNTDTIIRSLAAQVDPGLFAQKLCAVDLVTQDVLSSACVCAVPPPNRIQHVISAVQSQIHLESSNYNAFMVILKGVHLQLAKMLSNYFSKFHTQSVCYNKVETADVSVYIYA